MKPKATAGPGRGAIATIVMLSAFLNVLVLSGSIYMMLVYDMVIPSRNPVSLVGLLVILIVAYVFQAGFDLLRSDLFRRWATGLYQDNMRAAFLQAQKGDAGTNDPVKDLDTVRSYLSGPGPGGIIDLPWMLLYIAVLFMLHVWIGVATLAGVAVMLLIAWMTNRTLAARTEEAGRIAVDRQRTIDEGRGQSDTLASLGMRDRVVDIWSKSTAAHLDVQQRLAATTGNLGGVSRTFRMLLQSLILTVGALLVIAGEATGGVIFASSIIGARALAPIEAAITTWKPMLAARQAWRRLRDLAEPAGSRMPLARPSASLDVKDLAVTFPGRKDPALTGISFSLTPGDVLAVVGPSASGKTTLLRALAGQMPETHGAIRLDGASLDQWDADDLGRHLGYLPQEHGFLTGTVMQNISRFDPDADPEAVVAAARAAGAHDMVVRMQDGYNAGMGPQTTGHSGGQRQRIGLARALYGDPFLALLDEPNSNLDTEGEAALAAAIGGLRQRKAITVVASHRNAVLNAATHLLVLRDGAVQAFGPIREVMAKLKGGAAA